MKLKRFSQTSFFLVLLDDTLEIRNNKFQIKIRTYTQHVYETYFLNTTCCKIMN